MWEDVKFNAVERMKIRLANVCSDELKLRLSQRTGCGCRRNDDVLVEIKVFDMRSCCPRRHCTWDRHGEH